MERFLIKDVMKNLQPHEYANLFPMMSTDEMDALINDMRARGYDTSSPIVTYKGKILDGRNRYAAAKVAEVEAVFVEYDGTDLLSFVLSKNLHRRHLNETQRAGVAEKIAKLPHGGDRKSKNQEPNLVLDNRKAWGDEEDANAWEAKPLTRAQAASMLNVSKSTVTTYRAVAEAMPELVAKMDSGEMTANKAHTIVRQAAVRTERKAQQIPDGKYQVIYADPPWRYDFSQSESREIENQYPTMDIEDICSLPVSGMADENCILFLWATNPKLREALRVVEAWGFEYKTNMVWVKDKIGMGYYVRQKHELLLIATKGDHMTPPPDKRPESVLCADRTKHSKKPLEFYDLLDGMYPDTKKIE